MNDSLTDDNLSQQDIFSEDHEIPVLTAEEINFTDVTSLVLSTEETASTFSDAELQSVAEIKMNSEAPLPQKSKKNLNLSSEVWNHFGMGTEGLSVICNYCSRKMKRTDSSTKSMWGHLKSFHTQDVGPEVTIIIIYFFVYNQIIIKKILKLLFINKFRFLKKSATAAFLINALILIILQMHRLLQLLLC